MKILLIDDDTYWCQGLVDYAQLIAGWEMLHAASPLQGIEMLRQEKDSLNGVLLDVMMPPDAAAPEGEVDSGLSTGLFLLPRLLAITEDRIPIIILTARQDIDPDSLPDGVAAVIIKLLPTGSLLVAVEEILKDAARGRR